MTTTTTLPAFRAAIRGTQLTSDEREQITESRELIEKAYAAAYAYRPHNPEETEVSALWLAYCEAGDRLRADPTPANGQRAIDARAALENAAKNYRFLIDSLTPMVESHQRRLASIAGQVIDRAGEALKVDFEKRRHFIAKGHGCGIAEELSDHDNRLGTALANMEREREAACRPDAADAWLEENGF